MAAAGIPSQAHRPARALAAIRPMSMHRLTQTAIIIVRLRSKAARILYPVRNPFPRRQPRHRTIPYSLPPKRWQAHSLKLRLLEPASSPTLRAKPPCRLAPDVHRATWQHRRTMQRSRQGKQYPMRRIIMQKLCSPARAARPRRIRSRNRPYIPNQNPTRAAARRCQNHGGTVLSGAAGKAAAQNPPRSTNQPTDSCRKVVSQQQRTEADSTDRICTAAQHFCAAA